MAVHDVKNEADLTKVLQGADVLILDFWAPWCPACKAFAPLFQEAAGQHPDVAFCRINTEDEEGLAEAFDVTHIPSLVVIRDHVMVASEQGYLTVEEMAELLRQVRALDMDALRSTLAQPEGEP
jgi:thioredoxin 1